MKGMKDPDDELRQLKAYIARAKRLARVAVPKPPKPPAPPKDLRVEVLAAQERALRHPTLIGLETTHGRFHWIHPDAIESIGCPRIMPASTIDNDDKDIDENEEEDDDDDLPDMRPSHQRRVTVRQIILRTSSYENMKKASTLTILDTAENLRRLGFTKGE